MSNCNITTQISETLCLGDSLSILNNNFNNLDTTLCTLCSVSNNLIINLNNFSSIYNSNIFNVLNLINTPLATIQTFTPSYTIFTEQIYTNISTGGNAPFNNGTFTTYPPTIPTTATFIFVRADIYNLTNLTYTLYMSINGINIPIYGSQISGTATYPYAIIPVASIYNITLTESGLHGRPGRPSPTVPLSVRIIGYL